MGFVLESPLPRTGRARFVPGAVFVVLAVLTFGGYRASRPNLDPDTTSVTAAGVTVLVYTEDFEGPVDASETTASLAVVGGRCLGVVGTDGPELAVFPRGTTVRAEGGQVAVRVPGQYGFPPVTLQPGDTVSFGVVNGGPVTSFGGQLAEHTPRACADREALGLTQVSR